MLAGLRNLLISHDNMFHGLRNMLMSNKNNINKQIRFKDAFPIALGDLTFTTQDTAIEYVTCNVTFRYNQFDFIR